MSRFLFGFDVGTKQTGIAIGQTITGTARELAQLAHIKNKPDWEQIGKLIQEWQPSDLIVGLPLNMRGEPQEMTKVAEKFGRQLHGRFHLPVHHMDETLSSRAAREEYQEQGAQPEYVDATAAKLILQSWLNENND